MAYQSFKELRVWREARDLAVKLYKETADGRFSKDFGLRDQVRRSAVSVASNIAEGYERSTTKDVVRFLFISKGSLSELRTQLEIAHGVGYMDEKLFRAFDDKCTKIGAMLTRLIKARSSHSPIHPFTDSPERERLPEERP
ncbi:MAG: four helix bundle protein [Nitrospirae bacterium]|nr:four helix bundle protein [Nitrospirota bacterium]